MDEGERGQKKDSKSFQMMVGIVPKGLFERRPILHADEIRMSSKAM